MFRWAAHDHHTHETYFNNTVLTLLCVGSDVILDLNVIASHNVFLLFSGMSCVPVHIVFELVNISDI